MTESSRQEKYDSTNGLIYNGAYDGGPTYTTIAAHGDDIEVVISPRSTAVLSG